VAAGLRRSQGTAQFDKSGLGVTEIAQRDTGSLVRDRCLGSPYPRSAGEHSPRTGKRFGGPGVCENEEVIGPSRISGTIAIL